MSHFFSNKGIAKLFKEISAAYSVKGGDYFKIIAYDRAADSIEHATSELKDLWEDGELDSVPGLGKSIQGYLDELFKTGKVKHFDALKRELPAGMFSLLSIPGMGPKSAYKIAKELKVKDIKDLKLKAQKGLIRKLPGFGEKSEKDILSSIAEYENRSQRVTLPFAYNTAQRVIDYLKKHKDCQQIFPLGSLRRMVATVGDVDVAVASSNPAGILEHFKAFREISRVLTSGTVASSAVLKNGVQVDVKIQPPEAFGALLQHFTGSKNHNIKLREYALKKGLSLSEYGITPAKGGSASGGNGKTKKFTKEEDFYNFLGMDWIPPELREDTGEVEAAIAHKLPKLIELKDIKGDIHLHSSYPIEPSHDLGKNTFEEIVQKAKALNYEYIGLSDHSPGYSTHTKKQIVDLIKRRTGKIEQIKDSQKSVRVLNLLEIDILQNGELSVPEEGLKLLDGAIAGIHSSHRQDKKAITKRLLNAINCPYVKVISHPTGRLLLQRESYEANWPEIFEACKETGTILEINAWPNRLDLSDTLVKEALRYKIKFVIDSDSHAIDQMDNLKFGVAVARRGWAQKTDIANSLPWLEFKKLFGI